VAILPPNSDYTSKDFEALKKRLESLLRSVFPTWTDHQLINFGNILEEMFCFVGDVLSFNQDASARESRWLTATQRRNLIALVKLIDYVPARATAATVDQMFAFTDLAADVNLVAGQIVKSTGEDPIEFQLLSNATATIAEPTVTVLAEHSKTEEQIEQGSGEGDQAFTLSETPFFDVVSVIGASSGEWTEVDNFLSSGPTDQHFAVKLDNNDKATLIFGNGTAGAMPSDVLTMSYKTGGGAAGNVAAASLTKVDGGLLDVDGNPVTFTTTNPLAAAGGADRETLDQIKANAPASIRNPRTSVAREDFEDHATSPELIGGIVRALMLTHDEDTTIADNAGRLYAVAAGLTTFPSAAPAPGYALNIGPGFPSSAKLQEIRSIFVGNTQSRAPRPAPLTFGLQTLATTFLDTVVNAKIWLTKEAAATTATKHAVKVAIDAALIEFFRPELATGAKNEKIDFGYYLRLKTIDELQGEIALSDLFDVVRDVPGVRKIGRNDSDFTVTTETHTSINVVTGVQTAEHADVQIADAQFPRFKGTVLVDGDTGNPIT
jgi:hypothetical protein